MRSPDLQVTVAICTHDRPASLSTTLGTLVNQVDPDYSWELLIVANACSDETRQVGRGFQGRLPLRLVEEPTLGLSYARNRALSEMLGEVIYFTDDDVRLDRNWLKEYCRTAREQPRANYFAGRILADTADGAPPWFREETRGLFDGVFVSLDLGPQTRPLERSDPVPVGASFGLRRDLILRNGSFRTDLGVRGTENGRGEETEYFERARAGGATGVYVGTATCWHPVDWQRFRLLSLVRHGIASGVAYRKIYAPAQEGSLVRGALQLVRGAAQLALGRGDRYRRCLLNFGIEIGMRRAAREERG